MYGSGHPPCDKGEQTMATSSDAHDRALLDHALDLLARNSVLEYTGEYGPEVTTFIPFAAWLKQAGLLQGRRIRTYFGMGPYYFFLSEDELEFKTEPRQWVHVRDRYWPSNSTYHATASPWHVYSDYRQHYALRGMNFQRPVVFIQNKFTVEWDVGPINYIPVGALGRFLSRALERFSVVYSRPGSVKDAHKGYSRDHNLELSYPDNQILERFPEVVHLERLCADQALDYNLTKLEILAKSRLFVSVQGGGAHILAAFGDSILLMLDHEEYLGIEGREYPHAYQHGPYKYLAKVPPRLLVTRNFPDFIEGMQMMSRVTFDSGKIIIPSKLMPSVEKWTI
jgi:hypothetical protein